MTNEELDILRDRTLSIMKAVGALIDSGVITHYKDHEEQTLRYYANDIRDSDGFTLYMSYSVCTGGVLTIELVVRKNGDDNTCYLSVYDTVQEENVTLPELKQYLLAHPSLQYANFDEDTDFVYYINKKIEYNHTMVAFVALALAIEDFINFSQME